MKELVAGDASQTVVPSMTAAAYFLNLNNGAASLINVAKKLFWNENQKQYTKVISGDPFSASADFVERFERAKMPADVGGELRTGTDGHCCLGVEQPALRDNAAIWAKYRLDI